MSQSELLIVHSTFENELTSKADIVFPSVTFPEISATYTSMETRVLQVRMSIGTTGDADEDWRIISQLAKRLGSSSFNFSSDLEVFEELQANVEQYNRLDINKIQKFGQIWEY